MALKYFVVKFSDQFMFSSTYQVNVTIIIILHLASFLPPGKRCMGSMAIGWMDEILKVELNDLFLLTRNIRLYLQIDTVIAIFILPMQNVAQKWILHF